MKPIETIYKGYRFRSRLEARWAVFFDSLKIEWYYEIEGFALSDGSCYLPDFFLPKFCGDLWIEVKRAGADAAETAKARRFSEEAEVNVLIASGVPFQSAYTLVHGNNKFMGGNGEVDAVFKRKYLPSGINAGEYRLYLSPESLEFLDIDEAVAAARSHRFGERGGAE
jgi:hypothetical protein